MTDEVREPAQAPSRTPVWAKKGLVLEKLKQQGKHPQLIITAQCAMVTIEIALDKAEAFCMAQNIMNEMRKFERSSI